MVLEFQTFFVFFHGFTIGGSTVHSTVDDKDAFGSEPMTVGSMGFFNLHISIYFWSVFGVVFGGLKFQTRLEDSGGS